MTENYDKQFKKIAENDRKRHFQPTQKYSQAKARSEALKRAGGMYGDSAMKKFSSGMKKKYGDSGHHHSVYNPKGKKSD